MKQELSQEIPNGPGPFDPDEEREQQEKKPMGDVPQEDQPAHGGREEDEHRETSVPDYLDTF